jgi:flagellar basal body P-ring formation protein FlgA
MNSRPLLTLLLGMFLTLQCSASQETVVQQIETAVRQNLQQNIAAMAANDDRRVEFEIGRLDPRLNMPRCDKPLTTDYDRNAQQSRLSVRVSCSGTQPWSLYVPVRLQTWQNLITLRQSVARGQRLTEQDVAVVEVDSSNLRSGYFTNPQAVIGHQVRRNMNAGDPLYPAHLEAAQVVRRGDDVIITARGGVIAVQITGTALSDGRIGDQINVRNASSQRVIRATVVEEGVVEVQI